MERAEQRVHLDPPEAIKHLGPRPNAGFLEHLFGLNARKTGAVFGQADAVRRDFCYLEIVCWVGHAFLTIPIISQKYDGAYGSQGAAVGNRHPDVDLDYAIAILFGRNLTPRSSIRPRETRRSEGRSRSVPVEPPWSIQWARQRLAGEWEAFC